MRRKGIYDMHEEIALRGKRFFRSLDWPLLLFLVLFLDVKIIGKLIALLLIYTLRPDARFGLRLRASRLPLFYLGMIGIALLDWLLYGLYSESNYNITLICGLLNWVFCLLAVHQVKCSVERSDTAAIHRTLFVFFTINAALSFLMLARIMIETGSLNPYTYQGNYQQYFLGTGDYIKGLSFDTSSTNAFFNAFGVLYFLYRKQTAMVLICMSVLLLTGSNATIVLLLAAFAWPFFFRSSRERKSLIIVCCFLVILFTVGISPQNRVYAVSEAAKTLRNGKDDQATVNGPVPRITDIPDSILGPEQKKLKIATLYLDSVGYVFWKYKDSIYRLEGGAPPTIRPLPRPNINRPEYQARVDTSLMMKKFRQFTRDEGIAGRVDSVGLGCCKIPGKIMSLMQTEAFMAAHPGKLIAGDGLGRFSSKQAFRSTALGISGQYPTPWRYINPDFLHQHLALYFFYFTKGLELRSMVNAPDCVYDQLLAEYGLTGLVFFVIFYIGYFVRHLRRLTYGIPLLFIMGTGFFTGYWFEQLSVVVLFECMLLLDIKEGGVL
jgi:hypothetical protein